ncbi:MAG: hypothetical protein U0136_21530 [Bdellovibrionota bacterium]
MALKIRITANGTKLNAIVINGENKPRTQTLRHVLARFGTTAKVDISVNERRVLVAQLSAGADHFVIQPADGIPDLALTLGEDPLPEVFVTVGSDGQLTLSRENSRNKSPARDSGEHENGRRREKHRRKHRPSPVAPDVASTPPRVRICVNDKRIALVKCHPHGADPYKDRLLDILAQSRPGATSAQIPLASTGFFIEGRPVKTDGHEFLVRAVGDTPLVFRDQPVQALRVEFEGDCGRVKSIEPITDDEFNSAICAA